METRKFEAFVTRMTKDTAHQVWKKQAEDIKKINQVHAQNRNALERKYNDLLNKMEKVCEEMELLKQSSQSKQS